MLTLLNTSIRGDTAISGNEKNHRCALNKDCYLKIKSYASV